MILADTSAWVEYDRATGSAVDQRVTEIISADGPLAVTEPIVMEVLAGVRSDQREDDLRRLLLAVADVPALLAWEQRLTDRDVPHSPDAGDHLNLRALDSFPFELFVLGDEGAANLGITADADPVAGTHPVPSRDR